MTDAMRDMIAQLMGSNREEEEGRSIAPYDHHSVCRAFLVGCCPYDLVPDTRLQNLISCRKIHEPAHKADYLKAQSRKEHYYDVDAFELLESAIRVVDSEVKRIKDRLDKEARDQADTAECVKKQRMSELDEKVTKALEEMEQLGNLGKVEDSMRVSRTVDELHQRKTDLENTSELRLAGPGSNASRLRVCEDCGAQLNVNDHESRIADHFNGKMHLGMVECRERYAEMKETIEDRRRERREAIGEVYRPYVGSSSRGLSPPRRSDRDRERDRDSKGRDRDRERKRSRSRSRDRDRRDRGQDRERDRKRR